MFQKIRSMWLASTDALGLSLALGVVVSLAIPGVAPAQLQAAFGTGTSPSMISSAREQADCLWLAARDHGFYNMQHDVVTGKASESETALWVQFLDSTGSRDCGSSTVSVSALTDALAASLKEADLHFVSANDALYSKL